MSKLLCLLTLCLTTFNYTFTVKIDLAAGVGPAWNQILATEHFTVNNQNNAQAKSVLTGLDNPCAALSAALNFTFCERFYLELDIYDILGNRGSIFLNQSVQESPFNTITNLDGRLSTNVFEAAVISGINWPLYEKIFFTLGGGYLYFQANRRACFLRDTLKLHLHDIFQGGVVKAGPTIAISEKSNVQFVYLFGIGGLKTKIHRLPQHDTTFYDFPLFMNNIVIVSGSYRVNEKLSTAIAAIWYIAQAVKNGRVKQPPADAALYSNRFASFFRSQFYFMTLNLNYTF